MKINTEWNKGFAGRLRDARIAAGLSQTQAARLIEVSQAYISMAESGDRMIDAPIVARVCDVYHINPEWLLGLTDESDLPPELIAMTEKLAPSERHKLRTLLASMNR